jgi:RNA recognition motif-containing protein
MEEREQYKMEHTWFLVAMGAAGGAVVGFVLGVAAGKSGGGASQKGSSNKSTADTGSGVELYVGNLSYDIDDAMLRKEFSSCGKVVSARVIKNKYNNRSRGYGFVEMSSEDEAKKAVKATHGKEIMGRKLVVNIARSSSRD